MYGDSAQERLRDKLDYELWLLGFVAGKDETVEGGAGISKITLTNRQPGAVISVAVSLRDGSGAVAALEIMGAMSPLTFTAAYKVLDMVYEWILEENGGKVPWKFAEKINALSSSQPVYPPFLQREPWINDYLFALYANLLKFRNEVVHRNNFSVTDGELQVTTVEKGQSYTLAVSKGELGALVGTVRAAANLLLGVLPFGSETEQLLKYHLDRIQKLHGLAEFRQQQPVLIDAELKVSSEGLTAGRRTFPADLKLLREEVKRIHPNRSVLFNLEIVGLVDDKPTIKWRFPVDSVPQGDLFELKEDSYPDHRLALEEGEASQ